MGPLERLRGCVCASTCYIIESGGTVCCLACHSTAALQWEWERPQLASAWFHNQDYFILRYTQNTTLYHWERHKEWQWRWGGSSCQVEGVWWQINKWQMSLAMFWCFFFACWSQLDGSYKPIQCQNLWTPHCMAPFPTIYPPLCGDERERKRQNASMGKQDSQIELIDFIDPRISLMDTF